MDARISLVPLHAVYEGRNDNTQIYNLPAEQLGVFSTATALADAAKRRSIETAQTYTRRRRSVSTGSGRVSTASELGSTTDVKAKYKGKAIMQESKPLKKVKKRVQVQLDEREKVAAEPTQTQQIDWSDHAVLRYHAQLNRPYSIAEVRKNMVMYLKNLGGYKMNYFKGMKYEDIRPIFEKEKSSEKQSEESTKRQKIEVDKEKEELKAYLDLVLREEFAMEIESLATNEMLNDFDRQDVLDLHRLVKVRYMTSSLEGYDLMLWGDLKIIFELDEKDEV
ncbi:hypothetical protein Tco_1293585 [Tanacetum coccineum]